MRRLGLQFFPGRKPTWRRNETNGLMTRKANSKEEIDWHQYGQHILLPKLVPFALRCMKMFPNTLVQENDAPSHACKHQERLFMNTGVLRLLWPGNSPDLNIIQLCWPWIKRHTTRRGAPSEGEELKNAWIHYSKNDLSMNRIRSWIERMSQHIKEVIRLKGGDEYREGKDGGSSSV